MRFAKKRQDVVTYKGNNTGVNLANEINSFFTGDNVLGIQMPSPPGIDQKRYLFNNSNALTVNNLFKTEKNSQFNLNLVYLNDHENRESNARSTYYIPGEKMLVIDEEMNSARNTDRLETELHYELNEDKRYLKNSLNISGLWDHCLGDVLTATNIHQKLKEPSFSVSDNFSWTKRTSNNKGFTLNSSVGFKSTPQKLMIYPGVYPDMFNNGHDYAMLRQDTRINKFYLNNDLSLIQSIKWGRFSVYPDVKLDFEYRNLNSSIYSQNGNDQAVLVPADSMRNDLDWMKWAAKADARISYRSNRLRLDFGFPVEYTVIQLNNKITSGKETIDKYFFEPWIQISYTVNTNLKIQGSYRFHNRVGDMMSLYPGYILRSYRSLNRYDSRLSESSGNGGYIGFEYKDIVNMFFINSDVSYNFSKNNILYGQNFRGILSVVSSIEQETSQNSISINGRVSKGIDWKKVLFELVSSYGISSFQQLQQNMLIDCNSKGLNVSGSFSCRPVSLLDFNYKGDWGKSWSKIKTGGNAASFSSLKNNIDLDVNLPKDLVVNLGFEHYYNSASLGNKNLSFGDLGMTYIRKRIRYSLSWNNIFNTDSYTIASYGAVNSFQSIYHIRPANVMLKVKLILK